MSVRNYDLDLVTEDGIFIKRDVSLAHAFDTECVFLTSGDFSGLEVMEPSSDYPIIVSTQKLDFFVAVCMIGKTIYISNFLYTRNHTDCETGDVYSYIPVSCLPLDIVMFSDVRKLSINRNNGDLYLTEIGTQLVLKVNLRNKSCTQLG